jgi:predicted GNAT family acetyltransferase
LRTFATQFCDFEENSSKKGLERLLDLKTIPLCSASAQTSHREDYSAIQQNPFDTDGLENDRAAE